MNIIDEIYVSGFESTLCVNNKRGRLGKKLKKRCEKLDSALKRCDYSCRVDAVWSAFSEWSECPTCAIGGYQSRRRYCYGGDNGGAPCKGDWQEYRLCDYVETEDCQNDMIVIGLCLITHHYNHYQFVDFYFLKAWGSYFTLSHNKDSRYNKKISRNIIKTGDTRSSFDSD